MKYETITDSASDMLRIVALIDIPTFGIRAGNAGGLIETTDNLSQDGMCWVSDNARVYGNARVSGNAQVYGDARVYGNAQVYGDAQVYGNAWDKSPLYIQGSRHSLTNCKRGFIQIGCQCHSFCEWRENADEIGVGAGYTAEEIAEYKAYIDLFVLVGRK